jgi:fructose/tagatose bisphosphate aldolase
VFTLAARGAVGKSYDPRKYLAPARDAMTEAVRERIRFFGAAGKA